MAQNTKPGTKSTLHEAASSQETSQAQTHSSNKLECMICGFTSEYSIISHVVRKHKITTDQYRLLYPDKKIQIMKDDQRRKLSDLGKHRLEDPIARQKFDNWRSYPSEIKHWTKKGFSESEAKERVAEFQRSQALKGLSEKTKAKQSLLTSGNRNPMSLSSISRRHGVTLEEASLLTPGFGRTKEKHPMYGKNHTDDALSKIAKNTPRTQKNRSKAEDEIAAFLIQAGYEVQQNVAIGRYNVDLLIEDLRLVIEYFGDLWHCNPAKFESKDFNKRIKLYAQERWDRDNVKLVNLAKLDYNVLVIWEADWNASQQLQIKRVQDAADSARRLHRKS